MPVPLINLINGGRHASNDLDFQEFIIMPVGADSLLHALQIGTEVNLKLADILLDRFGKVALNTLAANQVLVGINIWVDTQVYRVELLCQTVEAWKMSDSVNVGPGIGNML